MGASEAHFQAPAAPFGTLRLSSYVGFSLG